MQKIISCTGEVGDVPKALDQCNALFILQVKLDIEDRLCYLSVPMELHRLGDRCPLNISTRLR